MRQEANRISTMVASNKLVDSKYSNIKMKEKQRKLIVVYTNTISHIICIARYKHNITNTKILDVISSVLPS